MFITWKIREEHDEGLGFVFPGRDLIHLRAACMAFDVCVQALVACYPTWLFDWPGFTHRAT